MKLLRNEIRRCCESAVFSRGNSIYLAKKILSMEANVEGDDVTLSGEVQGSASEPYTCDVSFMQMRDGSLAVTDYECDCPAYKTWNGMCKHCVALCLFYSDQLKVMQHKAKADNLGSRRSYDTDSDLQEVLRLYSAALDDEDALPPGSLRISAEFIKTPSYYYNSLGQICIGLKAGKDRLNIVKSIPAFVHSVIHGTDYQYGKRLTVRQSIELFDPDSQKLLEMLIAIVRENNPNIDLNSVYYGSSSARYMVLTGSQAAALMRLCMEQNGTLKISNEEYSCEDRDPPITLSIRQAERGALLSVPTFSRLCVGSDVICLRDNSLYFCSKEFQRKIYPFLCAIGAFGNYSTQKVEKYLSEKDFSRFTACVLPELRKVISVDEGDVDFEPYMPKTPEFCFYLSSTESNDIALRAEVSYGDTSYPLELWGSEFRNKAAEKPVLELVEYYFPFGSPYTQRETLGDDDVYRVLTEGLDRLREYGTVFVDDSLQTLRLSQSPPAQVGVSLHGELIDIELEASGYSVDEINAILDAYRLRKKYYRLKSGEFLSLSDGGLSVVAELSDSIGLHFDDNGKAQAPAYRAAYIDSALNRDDSSVDMRRNAEFKAQIMALKNFRDEDVGIPSSLCASLRGYQKSGYRWLCTLSAYSLGGILADDMGLGKTIQMLAYFLYCGGSFLVVCPASLIYNWESECRRFAPSISCHIMRGTREERMLELENSEGLTITSYDQLRRDIELYKDKHFDCCVLDEAQYIRNAETKAAKAVKMIHAGRRFALTGTPIENRLGDLWSIFDFLMPGYLFSKTEFRTRIEQPVTSGVETAKERLARLTGPFILRRKKADVLKELPDKQETVVYVEMTDEQRRLYNAQEQALRLSLQNTSEAEYLHHKIEYLSALTRLRQICCAPELYLENYGGGSGKLDACMELLTEAAESGHRTLVFSQFTAMLELLIERASQLGLSWLYLSGKNTSEQRRDMVCRFQQGECSVFFISLKAGGTGLNLTAADRVIHFDPWWNIAAEEQATDRTHRIGQTNKVLVTKLVCKNSIEERIIDLQERKRALSELVMDSESVRSAALDKNALLELLQSEAEIKG